MLHLQCFYASSMPAPFSCLCFFRGMAGEVFSPLLHGTLFVLLFRCRRFCDNARTCVSRRKCSLVEACEHMSTCESMPTQPAALPINYVAIALSCIPVDSVQHHLHCNSNHIYLITIFDLTTAKSSRLEAEPTQCKDVEQSFKNSRCMFICVVFQRVSQHCYVLEDLQQKSMGLVPGKARRLAGERAPYQGETPARWEGPGGAGKWRGTKKAAGSVHNPPNER
jgi:hypothetical protein